MSKSALLPLAFALTLTGTLAGTAAQAEGVTVAIACGSVGAEQAQCQQGAKEWEAKTGNTVNLVSTFGAITWMCIAYSHMLVV